MAGCPADLEVAAGKADERKAVLPPVRLPAVPHPPSPPPPPVFPPPPAEVVKGSKAVIREVSPARTATTSTSSWDSHHHLHDELIVGPIIERSQSRSRSRKEIRAEIRALERQLAHRPRGELGEREIVIYQEKTERQVVGPKPLRIEKDKKSRMSLIVPIRR